MMLMAGIALIPIQNSPARFLSHSSAFQWLQYRQLLPISNQFPAAYHTPSFIAIKIAWPAIDLGLCIYWAFICFPKKTRQFNNGFHMQNVIADSPGSR